MPTLFSKPKQQAASAPTAGGAGGPAKPLFNPEQIAKATKDYSSAGGAKWNQIMSNMGAGGGTGGDLPRRSKHKRQSWARSSASLPINQASAATRTKSRKS